MTRFIQHLSYKSHKDIYMHMLLSKFRRIFAFSLGYNMPPSKILRICLRQLKTKIIEINFPLKLIVSNILVNLFRIHKR